MKTCKVILSAVAMLASGAALARNPNYNEAKVAPYTLEDPLTFADGRKLSGPADWPARRAEILGMFAKEMYGQPPPAPEAVVTELREEGPTLAGLAIRRQYRMWFKADKSGPFIDWLLVLPNRIQGNDANAVDGRVVCENTEKVPVVLMLNYRGNHTVLDDAEVPPPEGGWQRKSAARTPEESARGYLRRSASRSTVPAGFLAARGYALLTASYAQVSPDVEVHGGDDERVAYTRIFDLWPKRDESRDDNTTALGAWAWALSRGLDLAGRISEIDAKRCVVTGSSRLAKAALLAAARDDRFVVCVANQTGGGGCPLAKRDYGENVSTEMQSFPHWYCRAYAKYVDNEQAMKFDQHLLIAAIAPRALLIEGFNEGWFDTKGEFLAARAASPAWEFLGKKGLPEGAFPRNYDTSLIGESLGYVRRGGMHGISEIDWGWTLDFADRALASSPVGCCTASGTGSWPVLREYRGEGLRRVAMPIGGVGTGAISLSGRGGLESFEIRNVAEKKFTPCRQSVHPAFVIRTKDEKGAVVARLLEGPLDKSLYEGAFGCNAPNHGYPRFAESVFRTAYPLAEVALSDPGVPVAVTLQAMNPLVKGDEDASGMPVALMRWRVTNKSQGPLSVTVAAAMPNPCGGSLSQERVASAALNGVAFRGDADRPGEKEPRNRETGEFAITVPKGSGAVTVGASVSHAGWSDGLDQFWRRLVERGDTGDMEGREKCAFGTLAVAVELKPGETKTIPFALSWRFPNRAQWERTSNGFYEDINHVGNRYCESFQSAVAAAESFFARLPELESKTVEFVRSVVDATGVPDVVKEAALFNLSTLRSPTCFRTADGHFFGWEGTGDSSGSCYGNCTHVWGYEHALVDIWPTLAKDMRDLEFRHAMTDEGAISFRVGLPLDRNAKRLGKAAADGQMQCIVKAYECWAKTGDDEWMRSLYPLVKKALEFSWAKGGWDADCDGVMEGCQHNTMDVDYYGPNPQMEFLYLAALQAVERLSAKFDDDGAFAAKCAELRAKGGAWTEKNLFNGEWYEHRVASAEGEFNPATRGSWTKLADLKNPDFQLGPGCLVDQLVGDYAARAAGLDPVADFAHARKATETILERNRREPDAPLFNHMRDFALAGERSLVMAWYPPDRKPKTPFPYYPESMTGFEYVVAAWLAETGDFAAAEEVVRDIRNRYDGEKRSPFDEAECGHHYARALAAWSVYRAFAARGK